MDAFIGTDAHETWALQFTVEKFLSSKAFMR
jgi:hypothetical protein